MAESTLSENLYNVELYLLANEMWTYAGYVHEAKKLIEGEKEMATSETWKFKVNLKFTEEDICQIIAKALNVERENVKLSKTIDGRSCYISAEVKKEIEVKPILKDDSEGG